MAEPSRTFGGQNVGDDLRPIDGSNPSAGADMLLASQPQAPAEIEPRNPGLVGLADQNAINDDDLLTEEELAATMAKLTGMAPTDMGVEYDHNENIAERLEERFLNDLGQELLEQIEADLESRKPWEQRFKRGLQIVGLEDFVWDKGAGPFEGASNAILPLLAEAAVQSQARFMEEIFPAAGPVKTKVMGQEDPQKREAADRVEAHMNYQLTLEDPTYFMESQKLGLYLPIFGTAYRKGYHDFVADRNVLRYLPGEDLILPYGARNLAEASRKTHRFKVGQNEYRSGCAAGAYVDVDLGDPPEAAPDELEQAKDKLENKAPVETEKDTQWTFYEVDTRLNVPGDEDKDEAGQPTGVDLPYTVTVEKESGKVLAIRRCWKASDPLKLMRTRYAEYWYLPGFGAYGTGLIHWIGTIAESGTDALRALLDSATWANLQGGFKAKDAGVKAGEMHRAPGEWLDVDMTADELAKAFHTPPVREPSETLFKLMGLLIDLGRRFSSTTDQMVGDQDSKGAPVGTTIALIEQGSKVYSGVHKRGHFAAGIEFGMLFDLNGEYIPPEGYPYQVPGDDLQVFQSDYDPQVVCTVPVSDPNIFSQTQRIALAQTRYQIWKDNPMYFRGFNVLKSLFKAFKDPEIEENMIDPDAVPIQDPVTENVSMATGRPVKAKDGENHDAHLIVHMSFAQHPQFGGLPQAQELLGPAMIAHIAEHVALKYAETQRKLGVPVPPINLTAQPGTSIAGDQQPQQTDAISIMAAQMVGQFMQQSGLVMTPPDQQQDEAAQDAHRLSEARTWSTIATGLAALAKAGQDLESGLQAEAAVEGENPPTGGGGAPGPVGALGPARPAAAPAKKPAAAPSPAVHVNVHPAPAAPAPAAGPAIPPHPASPPDQKPQHDETQDGPPAAPAPK